MDSREYRAKFVLKTKKCNDYPIGREIRHQEYGLLTRRVGENPLNGSARLRYVQNITDEEIVCLLTKVNWKNASDA